MTCHVTKMDLLNVSKNIFIYITEFAVIIKGLVGGKSKVITTPAVEDDPQRRKPDITRAMTFLNWKPKVVQYDIVFY